MSKIKQVYAHAEELLAEVEDGSIDLDEAYESLLDEYPMFTLDQVESIFNDVLEIGHV